MCGGGGVVAHQVWGTQSNLRAPTGRHFNLPVSFYSICSSPTCAPGVGGKDLHFELQKSLFPDCVRTCRDVPPGFLPSSFLPLTPSFPSASTSSKVDWGAPVSASLLQQLSLCKARGKVTREDRKRAAFTGLKVVACCCWLVTVIVLKPQQEWSERSSLFCLKPTIWTLGAMFNTF